MKPPPFLYTRPSTIDTALELLAGSDDAKVIAGGQSLVPMLNFRLARPETLVDVGQLAELQTFEETDDVLVLGAALRQRTVETSAAALRTCPLLCQALRHVGHLQIRNRGTIGGSLAHADPAAELPAAALALDAELVAASKDGSRTIPAADFFLGPYTTALREDELLTQVRIPAHPGARTAFVEVARRAGDFAIAGVAVAAYYADDAPVIRDIRLSAIGVGATAVRLGTAETSLVGRELTATARAEAAHAAAADVEPQGDHYADASYKRELVATLLARALEEVSA
jgi:CO/xanthine dehydrogenase FAD-binding subunit